MDRGERCQAIIDAVLRAGFGADRDAMEGLLDAAVGLSYVPDNGITADTLRLHLEASIANLAAAKTAKDITDKLRGREH